MMPIDPDGESTTTWMLRAEKAEAAYIDAEAQIFHLLAVLEEIANNHDCDPMAEAREALDHMRHK